MGNTVRFIGTGAADQPWKDIDSNDLVRGSTSSLVNGKILIDCGPTTWRDLQHWNVDLDALEALFFTHGHSDHCNRPNILKLVEAAKSLHVYASDKLAASLIEAGVPADRVTALTSLQKFSAAGLECQALPANHASVLPPQCPEGEQPLHYLFTDSAAQRRLFYALDGAWLPRETFLALIDQPVDTIVWDCTMGGSGDYRIFEHNSMDMIDIMLMTFGKLKITTAATQIWLDHLAWTLWPRDRDEAAALAASHRYNLAQDGMTINW